MRPIHALFLLAAAFSTHAAETLVSDAKTFEEAAKTAKAGDVLVLKNGEWKDARLKCRASGTIDVPLTIKIRTGINQSNPT